MSDWWRRFVNGCGFALCSFGRHKWVPYRSGRVGDPAYRCDRCGKTKGRVML